MPGSPQRPGLAVAAPAHAGAAGGASLPSAPADAVKAAHRLFPTGVTVVTTTTAEGPRGLAVNAFSSVSLDPPLIMVCVAEKATTHEPLFLAETFAVNILAAHQAHVAQHFAVSGGDKFHDLQWQPGRHGAPVIDEVSAYFEAALEHRIPAYTHTIFIGRVLDAAGSERPPLLYLGGRFFDGSAVQPASQPAPTARQGETGRT